ncbi:MAG: response regulator [bacterium]
MAPRPGTQPTPAPVMPAKASGDSKQKVVLPPKPAAAPPRAAPPKKREAEARILAVDDDKDTLDLLHETLHGRYDMLACLDSTDVPQLIDAFQPDLIITDVVMPKVSGFQLVEFLKKNPELDKVPIIFLSAKTTDADRRLADRLGAIMYLCKPFEPRDLLKEIDTLFRKHPPSKDPKKCALGQVQERIDMMTTYKLSTNPDLLHKIQSNQPLLRHAHEDLRERPYALRHPRLK